MEKGLWTTKNDIKVHVKNMDTNHLSNAIKFIEKNAKVVSKEYHDHGYDGDSYIPDFTQTSRMATKKEILKSIPIYREMVKELKIREMI